MNLDPQAGLRSVDWLAACGGDYVQQLLRDRPAPAADEVTDFARSWGLAAWQTALLSEQVALQRRSQQRFPNAHSWLWTERSLAQASDWDSAQLKSSLFPPEQLIVDACCGAGVDLIALGHRHSVVGIESDPTTAQLARHNLARHAAANPLLQLTKRAKVHCANFAATRLRSNDWLHIDPDRRPSSNQTPADNRSRTGRRTIVAEEFSPPLSEIMPAARRVAGAVLKLAPSSQFDPSTLAEINTHAARIWIGNRGECRQQLAVFGQACQQLSQFIDGDLAGGDHVGQHIAMLAKATSAARPAVSAFAAERWPQHSEAAMLPSDSNLLVARETSLPEYVYDLHAVLHASQLAGTWGRQHDLQPITSSRGYFCGSRYLSSQWLQSFRVLRVVAWDDRKIRRTLRELEAGHVEVKNRLHRMDASAFQRRYSRPDGRAICLLVTRFGQRVRAIVAERVHEAES